MGGQKAAGVEKNEGGKKGREHKYACLPWALRRILKGLKRNRISRGLKGETVHKDLSSLLLPEKSVEALKLALPCHIGKGPVGRVFSARTPRICNLLSFPWSEITQIC
ncbi:hypothetical protein KIL84_008071 [Mauremys mutica]|uniref:Uncharacterized protein n=1 Tax=Mauremys mutica TaxID=74926 RepID=A0A9D4AVP5_9SAUR|nr:hypothetical protein KIL84_008071 [Mauremys mutica]